MTLTIMLVASRAGRLVSRFGVRSVLGSGLIMLTAGLLLLARIGASGSAVVYVMIPGILTAAGIAMSIVPSTIAATQGAKEGQAGLASGLVNTSRQVGGGLGLAVLITLATQRTQPSDRHRRRQVPQALTDGFRLAYLIGAGLAAPGGAAHLHADAQARQLRPAAATAPDGRDRRRRRGFVAARRRVRATRTARRSAPTRPTAPTASSPTPSLHPPKLSTDQPTVTSQLAPGLHLHGELLRPQQPPARSARAVR